MTIRPSLSLMLVAALAGCGDSPTDVDASGINLLSSVEGAALANACILDAVPSTVWDFDWSDVPSATQYHLFVRAETAIYPVIDASDLTDSSYHGEAPAYIINANLEAWRWRVRALVGSEWGPWSEERGFSVDP